MWNNDFLYGSYRNRKFCNIWEDVEDFLADYKDNGIPTTITDESATTLFYLLYAQYGNSTIASSDENQFKYKVFSTIFQYAPSWEKRLEIQKQLRGLSIDELMDGGKAIYNQANHPNQAPTTDTLDEIPYINQQNVTKYKKSKIDAYTMIINLLKTDVTAELIDKFKKLFLTIVSPELPLYYVTDDEDGIETDTDTDND